MSTRVRCLSRGMFTIIVNSKNKYTLSVAPVGAVLRCTHPNAICIPNRTDVECVSNYGIYYKCNFILQPMGTHCVPSD